VQKALECDSTGADLQAGAAHMYSKILLDNPSARPGLKFEDYSSALRDIIKLSNPQFTIGIFGGWGSGKTTLMHAIENKLNEDSNEIISVWFNAWRYEKEEHLIIPAP
jgi:predicted KAP-like P-loop ATPase